MTMAVLSGSSTGLTKLGMLTLLLTTEGLLFTALTVSVGLAAGSTFGSRTIVSPVVLAFIAAAMVASHLPGKRGGRSFRGV